MIAHNSTVVVSTNQISTDSGEESTILDLESGTYYSLDSVGTSIWHLIQQPKSVVDIRDALLEKYQVEPEECDRDLQELLEDLAAKGLIEVQKNN